MRLIILGLVATGLVAGCVSDAPNDGAQYTDNVTQSPVVTPEEQKLADVENNTETVLPPEQEAAAVPKVVTQKTAEEAASISNSQNFEAVKAKETRASDKAKIEARKGKYKIFGPTSVPTRKNDINLAAYALAQKNPVGKKVYSRFGSGNGNCSTYSRNPDAAQRAFIRAGGPERDPRDLDTDGDGFACKWNPDVYRKMMQNG